MKRILAAGALALASFAAPAAADVPLTRAVTGHLTVPVQLGGRGTFQFVLDTGAEGSAVYQDFAEAQKLPQAGSIELVGQTGTASVPMARLESLTLDGVTQPLIKAVVLPPRGDGLPLSGIVGLDVFGGSILDYDQPRARVALLPAGTDVARLLGRAAKPVTATRLENGHFAIPMTVGGVTATAVVDTGARKTRINWLLARAIGLSPESPSLRPGTPVYGATNNRIDTHVGPVGDVRFGSVVLARAEAGIADLPVFENFGVADRPAIILGADWIEGVRMIVDFPRAAVWFAAAPAKGKN